MPRKIPQRMCVHCRIMRPKRELIRLVATKDGVISLDPSGRKPGRGAYVCRSRNCLEQAIRARKIDRGLKARMDETIIAALIAQMESLPVDFEEEDGTTVANKSKSSFP